MDIEIKLCNPQEKCNAKATDFFKFLVIVDQAVMLLKLRFATRQIRSVPFA